MPYQAETTFVPVMPSFRGFTAAMVRGVTGGSKAGGDAAAKAFGQSISSNRAVSDSGARAASTFAQAFSKNVARSNLNAATAKFEALEKRIGDTVEASSKKMVAARSTEEDATRKARVEELRLQELRDGGKAKASQLAAAEDRVARSQKTLKAAQDATRKSTQDYDDAVDKGARSLTSAKKVVDAAGKSYGSLGSRIRNALSGGGAGPGDVGKGAKQAGTKLGSALGAGALGAAAKFAGPIGLAFGGLTVISSAVSGFKRSIDLAGEFEKTMRLVGTTVGASSVELKDLTAVAVDMGAKTSFSAQGAAEAMVELAKGGLTQAQIKAGALQETLTLATAGGLELGNAASYVIQGLSAFGLKAGQAAEVSAALAGGANASTASVESMGLALSQVGSQAKTAGLSIQDTTAALAALDNAGVKGSDAGTSLKVFLQRLVPSTKQASEAFRDLGLTTFKAQAAQKFLRERGIKPLGDDQATLTKQLQKYAMELANADSYTTAAQKKFNDLAFESGALSNQFFDMKGNIKSVSEVSQVLQTALKGQTKEQKISTLNTLFGSDASRAAGILAEQGAKGLAKFVKATNDKGAADALAKNATLGYAGALEKFKGAVETAQISFGTKFLPILTQGLNFLADDGIPTFQAIGDILESTFAPALSTAQGGIKGFIDYLGSHQAVIIEFFKQLGDQAFDLGTALVSSAATGIDSFNALIQGVGVGIVSLADSLNGIPGFDIDTSGIQSALAQVDAGAKAAASGLRDQLNPMIADTKQRFDAAARTEIAKAGFRDAMTAAAAAVDKIGTKADGSQLKLKKFSDISKLADRDQMGLRDRIAAARRALDDQVGAAHRAGVGQKELTKTWQEGKSRLYDEFLQMGLSKKEARRLSEEYAGVKPKVETKVSQPGMKQAREDARGLDRDINGLNNKNVKITFATNGAALAKEYGVKVGSSAFRSAKAGAALDARGLDRGGLVGGTAARTPLSRGDDYVVRTLWGGQQPLRGGEGVQITEAMDGYEKQRLAAMNHGVLAGRSPASVRQQLGEGRARGGLTKKITATYEGRGAGLPDFASLSDRIANSVGDVLAKKVGQKLGNALDALGGAGGGTDGTINVGNPRGRTTWHGGAFTNLFAANLARAEKKAGQRIAVIQGGFRPTTSYSGTSHRGDAIDTNVNYKILRAMRSVGIATGDRTGLGNWAPHMHAVPTKGAGYGGGSAIWQAQDYLRRGGSKQSPRSPWGLARGGEVVAQMFDTGGYLQPGLTLAFNGTGQPERIRTAPQERALAEQRPTERHTHHHYDGFAEARSLMREAHQQQQVDDVIYQFSASGGAF